MVLSRTGKPWTARSVRVAQGQYHRIDVEIEVPPDALQDATLARNQAFVALETALGEQDLDQWLGGFEVVQRRDGSDPVERLAERFDAVRADILSHLPQSTWRQARNADAVMWSLIRLTPPAEPRSIRDELLMVQTACVDAVVCLQSGVPFHSGRFSTSERFCWLQVAGANGLQPDSVAVRSGMEDAIEAALAKAGSGAVIGGGTGSRFWCIDLALSDWRAAIPVLRQAFAQMPTQRDAWLRFADPEYADEWVTMRAGGPPPP